MERELTKWQLRLLIASYSGRIGWIEARLRELEGRPLLAAHCHYLRAGELALYRAMREDCQRSLGIIREREAAAIRANKREAAAIRSAELRVAAKLRKNAIARARRAAARAERPALAA